MFLAIAAVTLVSAAAAVGGILVAIHDARTVPAHGPAGIKLTAAEVQGRKLFADTCATCHTLAAVRSVGRVGPNLDALQPPASLVLYAIHNGFAAGIGQMPALQRQGRERHRSVRRSCRWALAGFRHASTDPGCRTENRRFSG
jgi:mono/diheme cytochrome c family protein